MPVFFRCKILCCWCGIDRVNTLLLVGAHTSCGIDTVAEKSRWPLVQILATFAEISGLPWSLRKILMYLVTLSPVMVTSGITSWGTLREACGPLPRTLHRIINRHNYNFACTMHKTTVATLSQQVASLSCWFGGNDITYRHLPEYLQPLI